MQNQKLNNKIAGRFFFRPLVAAHRPIIEELRDIFDYVGYAQQEIKSEGLSKKSISGCLDVLDKQPATSTKRVGQFKQPVRGYFAGEAGKLQGGCVWNASPGVVVSLFGSYKQKEPGNPLHGVTPYVLILPLIAVPLKSQSAL